MGCGDAHRGIGGRCGIGNGHGHRRRARGLHPGRGPWRRRGGRGWWRGRRDPGGRWCNEFAQQLCGHDHLCRTAQQTRLQGPKPCHMQHHHRTHDHGIAAHAPDRGKTISLGHIKMIAASALWIRANAQKCSDYLRKIHQVEPATKIRLPASVERSSMLCFPEESWQAEPVVPQSHCAARQPGLLRCIAPPRRGRSFRSIRIGWPRPARTGSHRSSCRHGHGGQSHGPKPGGKHRRSWRQAVWLAVERMIEIINTNLSHLQ